MNYSFYKYAYRTVRNEAITIGFLLAIMYSINLSTTTCHAGELHDAVISGHLTNVKNLIGNKHLSPNALDEKGYSPIYYALKHRVGREIISYLIDKKSDLSWKTPDGYPLISFFVIHGDSKLLDMALDHGLDPNITIPAGYIQDTPCMGCSALHIDAILSRNESTCCTKILLNHHSNPNVRTYTTLETPLHLAVRHSKMESVELLLRNGVDPNAMMMYGWTALHIAIEENNMVAAKSLIKHGANINIQDSEGNTPLHVALFNGSIKAVRFLVQNGALKNINNTYNKTPKDYAKGKGMHDIYEILNNNQQ
ncbi:MAG: ankyrin repeat domain-containing protein [Magnetococcales bacterium]|nr:ankyrin repeat domain-containing protein [Magnetococcales bacterium]